VDDVNDDDDCDSADCEAGIDEDDAGAAGDAAAFCFFVGGADDEPLRFLCAFFGTG
jgi:hypothetical protein